jgi:hypothetical protein
VRSLLAVLLSWLMPSTGKRRATPPAHTVPTQRLTDEPTRRLTITRSAVGVEIPSHRSPRPPAYLRGEDTPLIRPYLLAYEREQERRRQRDRRTAATLATLGIDFHGATA